MGKGVLTKVMKYELRYKEGCGDFYNMQHELWELQRQTREILNRTIQITYHWEYLDSEHLEETGRRFDIKQETGFKRLDGYIYDCLKDQYNTMASKNLNATIRNAWQKYGKHKKDILSGSMSVPSFKRDQPLLVVSHNVKIILDNGMPFVQVTLFSKKYKESHQLGNPRFSLLIKDNAQKSIFQSILGGKYELGECKIAYERVKGKKPKWFFYLTYNFSSVQSQLDPDKILGVDMGETCAIYASSYGEHGWLRISGGEITEFDKRETVRKCAAQDRRVSEYAEDIEERIRSLQNQAAHCGEGRIGHGTKTRIASVYKSKDRIAHYRDTINHRYSKALIEYAVKNGYGTIQMEDLSGIRDDTEHPKFLRHWTFYDLQSKIEYKAKENGITVKKISPRYTSQRCSQCGNIDAANRINQASFCCTKCGFKKNADYNASQNISIRNIEEIIEKEMGANRK